MTPKILNDLEQGTLRAASTLRIVTIYSGPDGSAKKILGQRMARNPAAVTKWNNIIDAAGYIRGLESLIGIGLKNDEASKAWRALVIWG